MKITPQIAGDPRATDAAGAIRRLNLPKSAGESAPTNQPSRSGARRPSVFAICWSLALGEGCVAGAVTAWLYGPAASFIVWVVDMHEHSVRALSR